ncbi:cryptochrome/photolyase family protein [Herpetosiphon giganteus]|uniref:cryptochrome/photolyase family protein n=1 Tax=Herpetosiphon giganteus TaxID=2029754 RepID=UPI00195E1432|nr:deoxyribodipyrimidine photo-lyase [Herpetosiphon giganteus]MBM7844622.1 deoxyribodipyrimidine photo-lyase [Herpetosiphon giganteus]
MPVICWFRRDLRLADHRALHAAVVASAGEVIPVFIFDDAILHDGYVGAALTGVTLAMLAALDHDLRQLGSRLIVRHGQPLAELQTLVHETQASGVYWNRDYLPYAIKRDTAVKHWLRQEGLQAHSFHDSVLVEPEGLKTKGQQKPYLVFGSYVKRWSELAYAQAEQLVSAPTKLVSPASDLSSLSIPQLADLGFELQQTLPTVGEAAAQQRLSQFFDRRRSLSVLKYDHARELPAEAGTSQLSVDLRMGSISIRQCLQRAVDLLTEPLTAEQRQGVDTWIKELAWRDYYTQLIYHNPQMLKQSLDPRYDQIEWRNDPAEFNAWQQGQTGYPIVDAGQRQLNQTAWMHNRVRMISASFLVKDLLIDWRWGERYFMQQLCDADPTANNGGWQWAAGSSGPSAQPYFRIFNPIAQSKKHDPQGTYIRRFVPELANVPDRYIHEPWTMPQTLQEHLGCVIGRDYPAPLVDHGFARERALAAYREALQQPTEA